MRIAVKVSLALALVALLFGPLPAQVQPLGWGAPMMNTWLLHNRGVQKELKLTDDQVKKIGAIPGEVRTKHQDKWNEVFKEQQAFFKKNNELQQTINAELRKAIPAALKPAQAKRLKQIEMQTLGILAFKDPEVRKTLQLTDEQRKALKAIWEAANKKTAFTRGTKFDEWMKMVETLNKETLEKAVALLTDDQKTTWKELAGDRFAGLEKLPLRGIWFTQFNAGRVGSLPYDQSIQKELKLTDEQKARLQKLPAEVRARHKEELDTLQEAIKKSNLKSSELGLVTSRETNKRILEVLKPAQRKRFKQIDLQQTGPFAFTRPDVQKDLKVTDDQKKDLNAINKDLGEAMNKAYRDAGTDRQKWDAIPKKLAALRKGALEKMMGTLTADQKKAWKEMTGAPFELKMEAIPQPKKT